MTNETDAAGWLLVSVATANSANSLRVQVWRKLKSLGALYLQQSVCLLPDRPPVQREVRRLAARVREQGGSARVLSMAFTDPAEELAVIGEFNDARDLEYTELLERLPELRAELDRELAAGNATYADVEESEADLTRFRSWLAKIEARDYFTAPGGQAARAEVEEAAAALAAFEEAAFADDTPNAVAAEPIRRSRAVEQR
ncbi:Chromate resistance protein ChrB [Nocardia nepalensis]|uniref:Chromate resistance protein ChrB n=1 Tax=Nocardia nepalensis TaxID=3375448 RepID=UPI003B685255